MKRFAAVLLIAQSACFFDARDSFLNPQQPKPKGASPCGPECFDDSPVVEPAITPPPISGGTLAVMTDGRLVAADSDRDLVYIATGASPDVATVALQPGDEPGRVVEGPDGFAYVALRRAGQVATIHLASGAVAARTAVCPAPRGLAWHDEDSVLYVACAGGELRELQPETGAIRTLWRGQDLRDVVLVPNGLLVSTFRRAELALVRFDGTVRPVEVPSSDQFTATIAWRLAPTADGAVLVHQAALAPNATTGVYGSSKPDLMGIRVDRVTVDVNGGVTVAPVTGLLRHAVLPVDVAATDRRNVAVVLAGQDAIMMPFDTTFMTQLPGQPTAVAFRGEERIIFTREPASLIIGERQILLGQASVRSTGHELFHTATRNGVACASCHAEGGDDGHVWPGVGAAFRTPSLRGGISKSAPFHWAGDLSGMKALVTEVMVRRMGGNDQSDARIAALERWVDAQPALPARMDIDVTAASRGAALFYSPQVGCAVCHTSGMGTNNATVDVGTGGAFQVPRLTEVGYRGGLMHDGRAANLRERFSPIIGGGDAHGRTSQLSDSELMDLIAYLETR